jgi:hypothetical protein
MADQFEVELQHLVARVAHELAREITSLILRRLGIDEGRVARGLGRLRGADLSQVLRQGARGRARRGAGGSARLKGTPAPRARATTEERAAIVAQVERVVAGMEGLSVGEIERHSGLPRSAVASALKALKDQGRMFMGGTKRFARYATTQEAADRASVEARGGS